MSPKPILIVEDDQDIRESLSEILEDAGYVVRSAANGLEGLQLLRRPEPPCVVILDLIMPVMSGVELYAAMQSDPELARIPVIISTSDPSRAPHGPLVIKKPVDLRRMLDAIATFCAG